jgi:hypothetical protein
MCAFSGTLRGAFSQAFVGDFIQVHFFMLKESFVEAEKSVDRVPRNALRLSQAVVPQHCDSWLASVARVLVARGSSGRSS